MSSLAREVGLAVRSLRNKPGFAFTAIVTLALGIGASTAIFSVVNAVLLRPLPYRDPDRLAIVWSDLRNRNVNDFPFSGGDFRDLREQGTLFQAVAGVSTGQQAITDEIAKPEMVKIAFSTTNLFSVLGVNAALGRGFIESDGTPQPPPTAAQSAAQPGTARRRAVVGGPTGGSLRRSATSADHRGAGPRLLAAALWRRQRRHRQDDPLRPTGRRDRRRPGARRRAAVCPPKADIERVPEIWAALRVNFDSASRINHNIRVIGRLKDGASLGGAQAQVDRLAA